MVKYYDCEILYHLGKANVVADALSRKTTGAPIRDVCLRMTVTSPLMDMIKGEHMEGLKYWKTERIRGRLHCLIETAGGLLTQCNRV